MKQILTFAITSLLLASVSCSKDESHVIKSKKKVEIDLNIAKTEVGTRALQSGFQDGNTIFVVFNGEQTYKNGAGFDVDHCLQLTYDGSEWKSTIDQDYINHLPATGTMDAFYVSRIPDGAMNLSSSGGNIDIQTNFLVEVVLVIRYEYCLKLLLTTVVDIRYDCAIYPLKMTRYICNATYRRST